MVEVDEGAITSLCAVESLISDGATDDGGDDDDVNGEDVDGADSDADKEPDVELSTL